MDDSAEVRGRKRRVERDDGLGDEVDEEEMDDSLRDDDDDEEKEKEEKREEGELVEEEGGGEGAEAERVNRLGESDSKRAYELGAREAAGPPESSGSGTKGEAEAKEISGNKKVAEAEAKTPTSNATCPTSMPELSPISVTQSIASISGPMFPEKELSLLNTDVLKPKPAKTGSAQIKPLTVKTTVPDGYSWRKYGQKQVKSPKGSRSYYRCTFSECCAKKIERSDDSGHVIEIVNKGIHSHDAPRKISSIRESRIALSPGPGTSGISERKSAETPIPDPPSSLKEPLVENTIIPERKRQSSSSTESADYKDIQIKEDDSVGPEPKRRMKKGSLPSPDPIDKSGKKPKVIVHATVDVAVSGDGYRWRKYGQKMVKGNPHPRNYYRCTSAGCPMRKHIETAVDNSNGVIITYKGDHDHVMPVPKKRHRPRSAPLIAAAPAPTNSVQLKKTDTQEVTSTQWSLGKEGEITSETLDVKGEKDKTIESAHTLLSIGFEIKQC